MLSHAFLNQSRYKADHQHTKLAASRQGRRCMEEGHGDERSFDNGSRGFFNNGRIGGKITWIADIDHPQNDDGWGASRSATHGKTGREVSTL